MALPIFLAVVSADAPVRWECLGELALRALRADLCAPRRRAVALPRHDEAHRPPRVRRSPAVVRTGNAQAMQRMLRPHGILLADEQCRDPLRAAAGVRFRVLSLARVVKPALDVQLLSRDSARLPAALCNGDEVL